MATKSKKQNPRKDRTCKSGQSGQRKRVTQLSVNLQLQTEALTKKDLRTWRNAWQYAINVDYPNRVPLYDVYGDVEVDMHLTGCVEKNLKGYVLDETCRGSLTNFSRQANVFNTILKF